MKTQTAPAPAPLDLSVGRMIITWEDGAPKVEFDPIGKISQGWFDRHTNVFQRAIQRAQVAQRNLARQGVE